MGQYDALWNEINGQSERSNAVRKTGDRTRAIRGQFDDVWEDASRPAARPDPVATSAAVARSPAPQRESVGPTSFGAEQSDLMGERDPTPRVSLPGSVFNNMPNPARARAIEDVGAPLSVETQMDIQRAYNRATPERRAAMSARPDFVGGASRALDRKYEEADPTALRALSERKEDVIASRIAQGETPSVAESSYAYGYGKDREVVRAEKSNYDFDAASEARDDSFAERGFDKGLESLKSGMAGVNQMVGSAISELGQAAEIESVDEFGRRLASGSAQQYKDAQRRLEAIGDNPDKVLNFVESGISGAMNMIPMLAGGAAGLATMGAMATGNGFAASTANGASFGDALRYGAAVGMAEVIGEKLSLGSLKGLFMRGGAGQTADSVANFLTDYIKYNLKEQGSEQVTNALSFGADKWMAGGLRPDATLNDYIKSVFDTAYETLATTMLVGGLGAGVRATSERFATDQGRVARAIDEGVNSSEFDKRAIDAAVIDSMRGDPRSISPIQTTRGAPPANLEQETNAGQALPANTTNQNQPITDQNSDGGDEELLRRAAATEKVYDEDGNEVLATAVNSQTNGSQPSTAVDTTADTAAGAAEPAGRETSASIPLGDASIWEPGVDLPPPESYDGIDPASRASQQKFLEGLVASPTFVSEGLTNVKLAEPDEIGQSKYDSLRQIVRTYKKLFNVNVVLADFGDATHHGYFDQKTGNVVLNVRSADLTQTISHEAFHAFEKKHPELFAPIYAATVQLAVPQSMARMFSTYGLMGNKDGKTELGKAVDALIADPTDQSARDNLAAVLSDPKNALARSELLAHMVGQASTPAMYAELVRRSGSASKANKVIQTLTDFLNGLYQKLFGRTVDYVGGPDGLKQIQTMMNDIHNEVQIRTAQSRADAKASRSAPKAASATAAVQSAPAATPAPAVAPSATPSATPATSVAQPAGETLTVGQAKVEGIKKKAKKQPEGAQGVNAGEPVQSTAVDQSIPANQEQKKNTPSVNAGNQQPTPEVVSEAPADMPASNGAKPAKKGVMTRKQAEDKLDDLSIDPDTKKSQVMALARKMVGAGLMPANEMGNLEQISKDRDMGPDDLISEMEAYVREQANDDPNESLFSKKVIGGFKTDTAKNGSMKVVGDVDAIRSALPDGVVGRPVEGGLLFTTSDSPRVRAALEGRKLGYGRQGEILKDLPMRDGKYVGAPDKFNTPAGLPKLRRLLRKLADEGAAGRYWYENSSKAVLRFTGGNIQEARKFVALLAIYSPQAKVDANSTFALRAWAQYKAGQPISVKTGVQDAKAQEAMSDVEKFWSGEKTGNFYLNLLRMIDPSTEGKQGATIDMWMMRAGQYANDAPTETQYSFMENETNRIAAALGWEPQQVQAAIWVAMKARMEDSGVKKRTEKTSEENGWIRFDTAVNAKGKKVKKRVILNEQEHRDNWLRHAFAHTVTPSNTADAKFDFEDGVRRHIGHVSFEARPGRSTGALPGIHTAPYAQQMELQLAVQRAFYDESGNDLLATKLGLLVESNDLLAPGYWQGEVSPSNQKLVAMAPNAGKAEKNKIDPAQKSLLNVYAAVAGLVARQEGVGYHKPFYSATKRDSNGLDIDIGRPINPAEAADLGRAIGDWMTENNKPNWEDKFGIISSAKGVRLVNYGAVENAVLQTEVMAAAAQVLPDGNVDLFASDGDLISNKWEENPDGQAYIARIRAEGRSDVLGWVRDFLAPRVEAVFGEYSKKYGWGDPVGSTVGVSDGLRYGRAGNEGDGNFSRAVQYEAQVKGAAPDFSDRPIQPEAVSLVGYHYSGVSRSTLNGKAYGSATSGTKGKEYERVMAAKDRRLRDRVYFYTAPMAQIPRAEPVVFGTEVHKANLLNIFDPRSGDDRVTSSKDKNEFESSVIDAGYDGYVAHGLGMIVLLNTKPIPVQHLGTKQSLAQDIGINPVMSGELKINFPVRSYIASDGKLTKKADGLLTLAQSDAVKQAAPSFGMEYGEYKVDPKEKEQANAALEEAGSDFRFSRLIALSHNAIDKINKTTPIVIGRVAQKAEDFAFQQRVEIIRKVYQDLPAGYNLPVPSMITSNAMRISKMPHQAVTWSIGILDKVLFSKHAADFDGVTAAEINRSMRDPVAILQSSRAADEYDIITDIVRTNEEGKTGPVVIVVKTNVSFSPEGFAPVRHTAVKSAYIRPISGKDNVSERISNVVNIRYLEAGRAKAVFEKARNGRFPEDAIRKELSKRRIPDWVNVVGEIGDRFSGPVEDMPMFSRPLDAAEREVEDRFRKDLRDNYEVRKAEYWEKNPQKLDVDAARDLSPEYNKEPSKYSAAVHEPASDFIKQLYGEQLSSMPKGSIVLFSAGGGGSGKGYILGGFAADIARAADLVYDTTMSGFESGQRRVQAAIDAGHKVSVVLVYRDPVAALNGAIGRASTSGRVVPINVMAKDHAAGRDAVKRLVEYYAGNPNFSAVAVDNNGTTPRYVSIDQVEQIDENSVLEDLYDELDRQSENPELAGVVAAFRAASPVRPADRMGVGRGRRGEVAEREDSRVRVQEGQTSGRDVRETQDDGLLSRKVLTQGDKFTLPERSVSERISNKFANEVSRVEDIQKDIVRQGGLLTDKSNVQWAQTRMYRKSASDVEKFREEKVYPLMRRIAKAGIKLEDLALYLYANHAQKRNAYIASINPQFPDGGSGMFDSEAKQKLTAFRARPDYKTFKALAKELQSITVDTAKVLVDGGLVDQNQVNAWRATYGDTYVPLKGWEDIDESMKVSHRSDPRVPFAKRALGRGSRAGQIIENILGDYERAIIAVEKNNVRKAFYRFVLDNPDEQLWQPQRIILTKRFNKGAVLSPLAMAQGNVTYSATVDNREGHTVAVRVGGQLKSIWVKDEAMLDDLQQAIDAVDGDTRLAMRTLMGINRTLAKSYTALSPAFVLTNATRDLQTALLTTGIEKKGGLWRAAKITAQLLPLSWNIWRATRNNEWTAVGNRYRDAYIAMRDAGGAQGFMGYMDLQDRQRKLNQIIEETQNNIRLNPKSWYIEGRKMIRGAHDFIMDINGAIEGAARVAAYAEAIKAGESKESAADTAANVTVDFARRGKWTPWISGLWLFANPAIQGARRVASLAFSPKGAAFTGSLVTLGYMVAMMSSGATGDDDEPYWDKPDVQDVKLKALVFFDPEGNQYRIPLAYGWGFFVNVGYALADIQRGKGVGKAAAFLTNSVFQHFSPLGVTDNMASFFAPTLLDLVVPVATNMTDRGRELMPSDSFGKEEPDSERYWPSTRGTYTQKATTWLNEFTGGSSAVPGYISVSPETVNHVRNFVLGGAGQFVSDAASSIYLTSTIGGATAVEKNKVPILKSFYRTKDIKGEQAAFFENSREALQALNEMKAHWGRDDNSTAVQERMDQNAGLAALGKSVAKYSKALTALRKEEMWYIDNKDISDADREAARSEIDQRRKELYDGFNTMFYANKKEIGN